jgi:hypothetical protein
VARYVDNGDDTVTDNQNGLMWEKKSAAGGSVHGATETYTWSDHWSATGAADGTLYTKFLATLNLDQSASGSSTCFANHCDWRIPNVVELQSILLAPFQCSTKPCIDPAFGPTQAWPYWSSSSWASNAGYAWEVYFGSGSVDLFGKTNWNYARAVRGGR